MITNVLGVVLANLVGLLFIFLITPHASRLGLIDRPSSTKIHDQPAALIGGLSIYCAVLTCLLLIERPEKLNYLLSGITLLVILGVIDDIVDLSVRPRITVHFIAVILMMFGGEVWISEFRISDSQIISFGPWGFLITGLLGVYAMNAFNMSDGIDGLAVIYALSCLILIIIGQASFTEFRQLPWITSLAIALVIFGIFNTGLIPNYKIFLGDAGSIPLGYILFWILVDFSQGGDLPSMHSVAAAWCLTVPIFDATSVCILRAMDGEHPTSRDQTHIHHKLLNLDLNKVQVLIILGTANFLLGAVGIFVTKTYGQLQGFLLYTLTFTIYFFLTWKLKAAKLKDETNNKK